MRVGIKFCGGCNPRYDRRGSLDTLIKADAEDDFKWAEEGEHYDILLVVGGCPSCCASFEQYDFDKAVKAWNPEDFTTANLR